MFRLFCNQLRTLASIFSSPSGYPQSSSIFSQEHILLCSNILRRQCCKFVLIHPLRTATRCCQHPHVDPQQPVRCPVWPAYLKKKPARLLKLRHEELLLASQAAHSNSDHAAGPKTSHCYQWVAQLYLIHSSRACVRRGSAPACEGSCQEGTQACAGQGAAAAAARQPADIGSAHEPGGCLHGKCALEGRYLGLWPAQDQA